MVCTRSGWSDRSATCGRRRRHRFREVAEAHVGSDELGRTDAGGEFDQAFGGPSDLAADHPGREPLIACRSQRMDEHRSIDQRAVRLCQRARSIARPGRCAAVANPPSTPAATPPRDVARVPALFDHIGLRWRRCRPPSVDAISSTESMCSTASVPRAVDSRRTCGSRSRLALRPRCSRRGELDRASVNVRRGSQRWRRRRPSDPSGLSGESCGGLTRSINTDFAPQRDRT